VVALVIAYEMCPFFALNCWENVIPKVAVSEIAKAKKELEKHK